MPEIAGRKSSCFPREQIHLVGVGRVAAQLQLARRIVQPRSLEAQHMKLKSSKPSKPSDLMVRLACTVRAYERAAAESRQKEDKGDLNSARRPALTGRKRVD